MLTKKNATICAGIAFRPIAEGEFPAFARAAASAFGETLTDELIEAERSTVEYDRSLAAFEGQSLVGASAVLTLELTVPGNTIIPMGGLTWVGVRPTHHRRGILTEFMQHHFASMRERGEIVSALDASESLIYGRFGYGPATQLLCFSLDRAYASLLRPPCPDGRLRMVEGDEAASLIPPLFERLRRVQPGEVTRNPEWWTLHFRDLELYREGDGPMLYVVHETGGRLDGYVSYRWQERWLHGLATNGVRVVELVAHTDTTRALLWHYCLNLDLVSTVSSNASPVDEPLRWMLADSRRLRATQVKDGLWVRLLDIAAALAARTYRVADTLVFAVEDPSLPDNRGRYRLEAGAAAAECRRTRDNPDLSLDVSALAMAYLGGHTFSALKAAGRVREEKTGALARADLMFGCSRAPVCLTTF